MLSIGLFDGIAALRVALDVLQAPVAGHVSVECNGAAQRVVEANFPGSLLVEGVEQVDEAMVTEWSLRFGMVGLVLVGAGPPCQGVSRLERRQAWCLERRQKLFVLPCLQDCNIVQKEVPLGPGKGLCGKRCVNGSGRLRGDE